MSEFIRAWCSSFAWLFFAIMAHVYLVRLHKRSHPALNVGILFVVAVLLLGLQAEITLWVYLLSLWCAGATFGLAIRDVLRKRNLLLLPKQQKHTQPVFSDDEADYFIESIDASKDGLGNLHSTGTQHQHAHIREGLTRNLCSEQHQAILFWVSALTLLSVCMVRLGVFQPVTVSGPSMYPSYHDGQKMLVSPRPDAIERGDVLVLRIAQTRERNILSYLFGGVSEKMLHGEDEWVVKRLIGLPGERVVYDENGKAAVFNAAGHLVHQEQQTQQEKRHKHHAVFAQDGYQTVFAPGDLNLPNVDYCKASSTQIECHVPENHIFVLGDNRPDSVDSRFFGAVERNQILGRVE